MGWNEIPIYILVLTLVLIVLHRLNVKNKSRTKAEHAGELPTDGYPAYADTDNDAREDKSPHSAPWGWVSVAISGLLLIASLVIILSAAYDQSTAKWAFGTVGTIVGYWLRPPTK